MKRACVLVFALVPAVAAADQVYTRGGGLLDGEIVERRPDSIVVDIGGGTIGLPLSYVERIVPGQSPVARYRARAERLAPNDTAGWLALAEWARAQDLHTQAAEALQRVLANDPGNPAAHLALGHVKVAHEWMTREEANRSRGLVPHEGAWVTRDEREAMLAEGEAAAAEVRAEAESLAHLRESEALADEAESRARVVAAEARIAEEEAQRVESAPIGLQWLPVGSAFGAFVSPVPGRVLGPGCSWRGRLAAGRGVVHIPGRGGAFVAASDLRPLARR